MSQTQQTQQDDTYYVTTVEVGDDKRRDLLDRANNWADELGSLRGSIEDGDGNTAGRYGELLFVELFGGKIVGDYDYDIKYNGLTVDVKSKRRTVKARPDYEASIADFNPDQSCDLYYFMSVRTGAVEDPYRYVDLLGYIRPEDYHDAATFHAEGERDPDNDFVFSADCYNLPYRRMARKQTLPQTITLTEDDNE